MLPDQANDQQEQPSLINDMPTLLIIDDVPSVTDTLARCLRHDVIVLTANNGMDARRIIAERPDISALLLDVTMPNYDSVEMLQDLAKSGHFPPIILFSGYWRNVMETVSNYAKGLGFNILTILEKPVSTTAILKCLQDMK